MAIPNAWTRPVSADLQFHFRIGESVLVEFARAHEPAAILRELIQNEYDAGGSHLEVSFGEEALKIKGNGEPVDRKGWRRLSVIMGTGRVGGTSELIQPKANGIGSKNFGLRSLFVFGDELYIRSNGWQTILDLKRGSLPKPISDPASANTRGIEIFVPYRTKKLGRLDPFTFDAEAKVLDNFAQAISLALLKLADVSAPKSLRTVVVSSSRHGRRIEWKQSVRRLKSPARGVTLLSRRVQMLDSTCGVDQTIEELEWQRNFSLPPQFDLASIPGYFQRSHRRVRLGVALRTKRGRLHADLPAGIVYYPIGVPRVYTGNAVSLNAPFDMDFDRSLLNNPTNSAINAWLLDRLAEMTIDLLKEDWFERFRSKAYLAVCDLREASVPTYSEAVRNCLRSATAWPRRSNSSTKGSRIEFARATELNFPTKPKLDGFLSDAGRYLHPGITDDSAAAALAVKYGAKRFSLNSLLRLFCCGSDTTKLKTKLATDESDFYYTNYPAALTNVKLQVRVMECIDVLRQDLSTANRLDLECSLLLSASGELRYPKDLRWIPPEIQDACPLPARDRLHPELGAFVTARKLCKKFNSDQWVSEVAARATMGLVSNDDRMALYRFVLAVSGQLPRATRAALTKAPILRDHREQWVQPSSITLAETPGARDLEAVLHLPHEEFRGNTVLARALRFRRTITCEDLITYARLVAQNPSLAPAFEQILWRFRRLLSPKTVAQLREISFVLSHDGTLCTPGDLYLRNSANLACVGPAAPYPFSKRTPLYRLLGCKEVPDGDGMLEYLKDLAEAEIQPPQPERLYPELVRALRRAGKSLIAHNKDKILWTDSGYGAPADTLVGNRRTKLFAGCVPCAVDLAPVVRDAYIDLGASTRPLLRHWTQLLVAIGEEYLCNPKPLSGQRRAAIQTAYREMEVLPNIPEHVPWLLDHDGRLHRSAVVHEARFLIDDEPTLADALRSVGANIAFADASDPSLLPFFTRAGVRSLAEVRERAHPTIGSRRTAPLWFREAEVLDHLTQPTFLDAVETIALHRFRTLRGARERFRAATQRLGSVREIVFVQTLSARYQVGDFAVSVPVRATWKAGVVYLTWVRGHAEMNGLLAGLVAEEYLDRVSDQRSLADAVYRLLTSDSDRELRAYLQAWGIRLQGGSLRDEEAQTDRAAAGTEQIEEAIRAALMQSVEMATQQLCRPTGHDTAVPISSATNANAKDNDLPEAMPLPPIEEVVPVTSEPTGAWSPESTQSKTGTSSGRPRPDAARASERDKEVGRRGEEIVLRMERSRVRQFGLPDDRVRWIADETPSADFDILSVDEDGGELISGVKATTGGDGRFHWSRAEFQRALRERGRYVLYRVYRATSRAPVVRAFRDPIAILGSGIMRLDIEVFHGEVEPL